MMLIDSARVDNYSGLILLSEHSIPEGESQRTRPQVRWIHTRLLGASVADGRLRLRDHTGSRREVRITAAGRTMERHDWRTHERRTLRFL